MHALRHLVLTHRSMAVLVCALALVLRVLIPGGYMLTAGPAGWAVTLCPGTMPVAAVPMAGMAHASAAHGDAHRPTEEHRQADMPCAFAGLAAPLLGGVDAVLLVAALAVVAVLALLDRPRAPARRTPHLRPPLRGPPAIA